MDMSMIFKPIAILFIVIFIGFLSVKCKYLGPEVRMVISKLIVKITLPLLIITSLLSKEYSVEAFENAVIVVLTALIVIPLLFVLGIGTAKMFRLKEPTKTIHAVLSASGNVAFLGYPLILAIYGTEGLFYAVLYSMVNDALLWTVGVHLISRTSEKQDGKQIIKKLLNPNTIAFLIAIPLMLMHVKLPHVLYEALSGIGGTTTYLSMIFTGMTLALVDVTKLYQRVSMLLPVVIKMIIVPVLTALLLVYIGADKLVAGVVMMQIAMPAQIVVSIMAMEANSDEQYAAEYIFFSTLVSIGTLPLMYYIMERIVG